MLHAADNQGSLCQAPIPCVEPRYATCSRNVASSASGSTGG